MNYYERHLGDYARDAGHLSMLEHGAYTLLLDRHYTTEQGIPADQAHRICRARSRDERQAVDTVLAEFFTLLDGRWVNGRAERETTKMQAKVKAAQENGKLGGRPKRTQQKPSGLLVGSISETQEKAHQTPDTRHQINTPKPPAASPDGFAEFWDRYPKKVGKPAAIKAFRSARINGHLPEVLADVERKAQSEAWIKDGGQFIPNPATYLNQRRWEDRIDALQSDPFAGAI